MEKVNEGKHPQGTASAKEIKDASSSDVPAEELEDNRGIESDSESNSESSSSSDSDSEFECEVCDKSFSDYLPYKQHLKGKKHAKALFKKKKENKLKKIRTTSESDELDLIQEQYAECKICDKEFNGPEGYEKHLKSKKHKQKVLVASILDQVQEEGKINEDKLRDLYKKKRMTDNAIEHGKEKMASLTLDDEDENEEKEFECKECDNTFSGLIPYTQHLTSKVHAKRLEKKNLLHKIIPDTSEKDEVSKINALCIEDDVLICKLCSTSFSGPENGLMHMKSKNHAKNLEKYVRKLERKKKKEQSKDSTDFNVSKGTTVEGEEHENHDEAIKEKLQTTYGDSSKSEVSNNPENNTINSSTSSNQVNESLIAHEKYKEYKAVMNSLREDEIMK